MIDYIINSLKGIFNKSEKKDYVLEEKTVERKPKPVKVGKKSKKSVKKSVKKK